MRHSKLAVTGFLKKCMFNETYKKEFDDRSFEELLEKFQDIRDNTQIETKEQAEAVLKEIEVLLHMMNASAKLLHYFYFNFHQYLDYEKKAEEFGKERVSEYTKTVRIQLTREGGAQYKFKR